MHYTSAGRSWVEMIPCSMSMAVPVPPLSHLGQQHCQQQKAPDLQSLGFGGSSAMNDISETCL